MAEPHVRADPRLFEPAYELGPVGDVVGGAGVVVIDDQVLVGEDREPGRVDAGLRREAVRVRRKVIGVEDVPLSCVDERRREELHEALELSLFVGMRHVRAQRTGLHLLEADDRR